MTLEEDEKDAENQLFLLQDRLMTMDVAGHALREAGQERLATLVFTTVLNLQGMVVVMERIIARIDQEISAERESRQKCSPKNEGGACKKCGGEHLPLFISGLCANCEPEPILSPESAASRPSTDGQCPAHYNDEGVEKHCNGTMELRIHAGTGKEGDGPRSWYQCTACRHINGVVWHKNLKAA